jgi:O-antigen/teichoic acid export membrane protein
MMVSAMLGLESNAIYTTAFYIATVIEIPRRALSQITMPLISKAFEQYEINEVAKLYRKTSINQFIIGSLVLIGVWINLDSIFSLMPKGENYELGKWIVIIVGSGKLIDMLCGPSSEIIVLSKYYQFNIILILTLATIVILSNNILIPLYGIEGAAWGSALALVLFNLVKFIFIYIKYQIQPFEWATLKVLCIGILTYILNTFLPPQENIFIDIFFRSSVVTVFFSWLIIWSKASEDANGIFNTIVGHIIKRN